MARPRMEIYHDSYYALQRLYNGYLDLKVDKRLKIRAFDDFYTDFIPLILESRLGKIFMRPFLSLQIVFEKPNTIC